MRAVLPTLFVILASSPLSASHTPLIGAILDHETGSFYASALTRGVLVDVYTVLASRLDRPIQHRSLDRREIAAELSRGTADLAGLLRRGEVEPENATRVGPVYDMELAVMSERRVRDYEDLAGLRIACLTGLTYGTRFDSDPDIACRPVTSMAEAVDAWQRGSVDAIAGPLPQLLEALPPGTPARLNRLTVARLPLWLYVRNGVFDADQLDVIRETVRMLRTSGMIDLWQARYVEQKTAD